MRGNGEIGIQHKTLFPILAKLSFKNPTKWNKHILAVQIIINSTISAVTKLFPFKLLTSVKMKNKVDLMIKQLLEAEHMELLMDHK